MRQRKGFTLIELLIVIAIIGLLATLAIVSLTTAQRKARDTKRISDVKQIQNAAELYYSQNGGEYPTEATWAALSTELDGILNPLPTDPRNNGTYYYSYMVDTGLSAYVIGATLEVVDHEALAGDYSEENTLAAGTFLSGDVLTSFAPDASTLARSAAGAAADGMYCNDSDGTGTVVAGAYCVSQQ